MEKRGGFLPGATLAVRACVLLGLLAVPSKGDGNNPPANGGQRSSGDENGNPLPPVPAVKRNWDPEQATGPPDTTQAGDLPTAWASRSPDAQQEWLLLEYAKPVVPKAVLVYETFNPGALSKVSVLKADGSEVKVWSGKDPTPPEKKKGVSAIPIKVEHKVKKVKIYLDSPAIPGWNEIDAVGLRDGTGKTQWATAAQASSSFAQQLPPANAATLPALQQRVIQLEAENRQLKKRIAELTAALKKKPKKN